ncbi:SDR family oxidoreductase [Achromobacter sp. GG226]|uniref:SDR family NAD(P)-dependent oxidoreductase n=1 Tax=Verticiella alkaliphila TaxID=2779529 RepID=UPI001C0B13E0|nr:SDR family oxidoreductase [Verticiella sp. GG226]MBU4611722.1 SDR family oxidoreductase [Verticiella sp. GG226]
MNPVKPRPVAIVTGAASGIGFAIARHLAQQDYAVVIADRQDAATAAARLAETGAQVHGHAVDVADEQAVADLVAATEARFGRLDALVNNAGIYASLVPKPFSSLTLAEWRAVFEVNVFGLFTCCREAAPAFQRAGGGAIVNIASGVAFKGNPLMAHYVASKGAVVSLTRALATEMGADGVRVNSVAPGFTLSDGVHANPTLVAGVKGPSLKGRVLARDMLPDDLVGAVAFLAGPGAGFITGQTLVVDGGAYFH